MWIDFQKMVNLDGTKLVVLCLWCLVFGVGLVISEDCKPIEQCGPLARIVPDCNKNKSEVVSCLEQSCSVKQTSVQQLIDVHQTAFDVLCNNEELQKGFKGEDTCWFTATACAKGHILGDNIHVTPEVCYMRKHGINACKCMGGPTCSDILDKFFDDLYSESSCDGTRIISDVIVILLAAIVSISRNYF